MPGIMLEAVLMPLLLYFLHALLSKPVWPLARACMGYFAANAHDLAALCKHRTPSRGDPCLRDTFAPSPYKCPCACFNAYITEPPNKGQLQLEGHWPRKQNLLAHAQHTSPVVPEPC